MYELMVEETFDAAHALRGYNGPCENLHGHTWKVQIFFQGDQLNELGILIDFKTAKKALEEILKDYDHKNLNELPAFQQINPSSENLARVIHQAIKVKLPGLVKTTVWESATTCASYN